MEIPPKLTREVKQLRDYVSQNGLKKYRETYIKPILDKWRGIDVNIAVMVTLELENQVLSTLY